MNTKKKEIISEWIAAVSKGLVTAGCVGLVLKYLRETWWAVENAKSVKRWCIDGDEIPPMTDGGVACEPESEG